MKLRIITAALALLLSFSYANAQAPRVRTSAPREKTAQPKGKQSAEKKPAPTLAKNAAETKAGDESLKATEKKGRKGKSPRPDSKTTVSGTGRYMAVKNNLAYDAFAVLNAGFEIQVADRFSVDLPITWSLWDWKRDMGLRVVVFQPEARYWFGNVGSGSAVGVNLGIATYNFRHNDIRYQDAGRPLLSAAVSYTYALSIGSRWSAEFSLAAGYVNTRYNRYYNIDNGALINTKTLEYFGLTKVGVSLCYLLGN